MAVNHKNFLSNYISSLRSYDNYNRILNPDYRFEIIDNNPDNDTGGSNNSGYRIVLNSVEKREKLFPTTDGKLTTFFTSSTQENKTHYLNIYSENPQLSSSAVPKFSLAYGHPWGSGSSTSSVDATRHVYTQFRNQLVESSTEQSINARRQWKFKGLGGEMMFDKVFEHGRSIDFTTHTASYSAYGYEASGAVFVHISPEIVRDMIDYRNFTFKIGNAVFTPVTNSVIQIGNTSEYTVPEVLYLTSSYTAVGGNMLADGVFMPWQGIIAVSPAAFSGSAWKLGPTSYSSSTSYLETLYTRLGELGSTSIQYVNSQTYFLRVRYNKFNWTINKTFNTNKNPKSTVYITTVGLYQGNDLVAIAKLSKPVKKTFGEELLLKVKLDY